LLAGGESHEGREMDHIIHTLKKRMECLLFANIGFDKSEMGMREVPHQRVPSKKEVVDDGDPVTTVEQLAREQRPYIACAAGDEDVR
jgi:hypothetical protein